MKLLTSFIIAEFQKTDGLSGEVESWEGHTYPLKFSFLYTAAHMTLNARLFSKGSIHNKKSNQEAT